MKKQILIASQWRKIRKELNLTQVEFARLVGVSQSFISRLENGLRSITPELLHRICMVLRIVPEDLGYSILTVTEAEELKNKDSTTRIQNITKIKSSRNRDF